MLRKHSISIRGHKTSYSLEDDFYAELVRIAAETDTSLATMITKIDSKRAADVNLSSALRLHVLHDLKSSGAIKA
jgi:predicted DNA-binding ribbon-helix-helix protein